MIVQRKNVKSQLILGGLIINMAYHKIKLRNDESYKPVVCPYADSGICYRRGCIFIPHQHCLNKREYDKRMAKAKNISSKNQKFVKRAKTDEELCIKVVNSSSYGKIINKRGDKSWK